MRSTSFVTLGMILGAMTLCMAGTAAEAKPTPRASKHEHSAKAHRVAIQTPGSVREARAEGGGRGQSSGAPWQGSLTHASKLKSGDRYFLRRPARTYGTRTTVTNLRRAIRETLDDLPKVHDLAIGDLSEEGGGQLSGHHSHRSGRDVDVGLFYKSQPKNYPKEFVAATEANLNRSATWRLITKLLATSTDDGGVEVIFLDYNVQAMIYKWAKTNGVSETRLERVFQYPHGRDAGTGLVRHWPHHEDHLHVRFHCASTDTGCR